MDLTSILGGIAALFTATAAVLGAIVALMKQRTASLREEIDTAINVNREIQKSQQHKISMLLDEVRDLKIENDQLRKTNENTPD